MQSSFTSGGSGIVRHGIAALVAAGVGLFGAQAAHAVTIWNFDLPATGLPSLNSPYPTVATLTLTQTADGVQFVLDPNDASPGWGDASYIERVDFVYAGSALDASNFRNDAGIPGAFGFRDNPNNVDAGYKADAFHIVVDFPSRRGDRLTPTDSSTWTVLGATIDEFESFATAHNKASPSFGVISVTAYSLTNPHPTPSNWVAQVPEPGTSVLVLIGLGGLGCAGRRRPTPAS